MSRYFALVPAAGHSSRMGQPKLVLPVAGQPLIAHLLAAWGRGGVDEVLVVVRPDDQELMGILQIADARVVVPDVAPPDMKASLQAALRHIERNLSPELGDAFLVAPADMPQLSAAIIHRLIAEHPAHPLQILVPTLAGRRGHPILFPWPLAAEVHRLKTDESLQTVTRSHEPLAIPCDQIVDQQANPFADIDTWDDYRELVREGEKPDG